MVHTLTVLTSIALLGLMNLLQPNEIRLWPGDAPLAKGKEAFDIPSLTVYKPKTPCGSAVVVCPGGAYSMLAEHEGKDYALYLNRFGIAAFVLKYRLGSNGYHQPAMLLDVSRAIRTVRLRAKEFSVDPLKIGVMGSSAGGHLASTVLTHFDSGDSNSSDPIDRLSSRPDFGVLCYAVISLSKIGHEYSKKMLLGDNPPEALVRDLSNETQVKSDTPPCFIWHTFEDGAVPVENSQMFADALKKAGVPYELHVYEKGQHGIGLNAKPDSDNVHPWARELIRWMIERGWATRA